MRILIISGMFPPNAPTATVRAPKFARYLTERNHDVRVLAAQNLQFPAAVDPEIPRDRVTHVPYVRFGKSAPLTEADQRRPAPSGKARASQDSPSLLTRLKQSWWRLRQLPDAHRPWVEPAIAAGLKLIEEWRPDILFSTGPPDSSHMVAAALSEKTGVPFVAELRDLWADNLYADSRPFVEWVEMRLERRVLSKASAIVAVTEGAVERLSARYGVPVVQAANGYDPTDFTGLENVAPLDPEALTIVHAGSTYGGRRSPRPLFAALGTMGAAANDVRVRLYGEDAEIGLEMAQEEGVANLVETHPPIPRAEVLRIERAADILLLLRFDTEGEKHVVAGKLYEYAGARRPILCHGQLEGEAADVIRRNKLGLVSNDPAEIAAWLSEKTQQRKAGRLPDLPDGPALALTRSEQFAKVERLLNDVVG
jgi:hypothetical protein|tara:strand:+ start:70020 stop:71291 length:1272 start_codon:yes stop_codon:yes gene_type:complete